MELAEVTPKLLIFQYTTHTERLEGSDWVSEGADETTPKDIQPKSTAIKFIFVCKFEDCVKVGNSACQNNVFKLLWRVFRIVMKIIVMLALLT